MRGHSRNLTAIIESLDFDLIAYIIDTIPSVKDEVEMVGSLLKLVKEATPVSMTVFWPI